MENDAPILAEERTFKRLDPSDDKPFSVQLRDGRWLTLLILGDENRSLYIPYICIDGIPANATINKRGDLVITAETGLGEMPVRPTT